MISSRHKFLHMHAAFLLFLVCLLCTYGFYLLSFTLFEGFATLSTDAASYILLARKWSPFVVPSEAVLQTWPVHSFPPGFPWALAISGASTSLQLAHLFVSMCYLVSVALASWMTYRAVGWPGGVAMSFALCLLPGGLVATMVIGSENMYLLISLLVLLIYYRIASNQRMTLGSLILLLGLLTLTILTRTIGLALILAVATTALINRRVQNRQRVALFVVSLLALILWALSNLTTVRPKGLTYFEYFSNNLADMGPGVANLAVGLGQQSLQNLSEVLFQFHAYLSSSPPGSGSFLVSAGLLALCVFALLKRALQVHVDAIYLLFYFAIILVWPNPEQTQRFLHPAIMLLILQPVFYAGFPGGENERRLATPVSLIVAAAMVITALPAQIQIIDHQAQARSEHQALLHSYEYYRSPYDDQAKFYAAAYTGVMSAMRASAIDVPEDTVVASVKHEFYSVLAQRKAVNLTAIVSLPQQMCNLRVAGVGAIFISDLTTDYNPLGNKIAERFAAITSRSITQRNMEDFVKTKVLILDPEKRDAAAGAAGECFEFRQQPQRSDLNSVNDLQ